MFDGGAKLLIRDGNQAKTEAGIRKQFVILGAIEGLLEAAGEYRRTQSKLFQDKNPVASPMYKATEETRKRIDQKYNELVEMLNDVEELDRPEGEESNGKAIFG